MTPPVNKSFLLLLFNFILLSSCIWQDMNPCDEDAHLCFVSDYNLQYVDLFPQEVNDLTVFVFDRNETLYQIYRDKVEGYFPSDYEMKISLEEDNYTFVVWSGLSDDFFTNTLTRTTTYMHDLLVCLKHDDDENIVKRRLPTLWHGKLEKKWDKHSPGTVRLTKNTNTIRIVMKNLDEEGDEIDIRDFDIVLSCSNGIYDYENKPLEELYEYYPYYTANHPETGAIAELNTLRLMAGQKNTLKIIHRETGENILGKEINLNTYFDTLRLLQYEEMPFQEYLDRETHYGVVFFYKGFDQNKPGFINFDIQVNGWNFREQDIEY
ncbi:MAG: FimB/Mfa2 family fimbrial subunit [Tannerellaceae bacterium]|nr:FimB/Mfa2 family fimbrial subunit [Tannerellaceae bacterium]